MITDEWIVGGTRENVYVHWQHMSPYRLFAYFSDLHDTGLTSVNDYETGHDRYFNFTNWFVVV